MLTHRVDLGDLAADMPVLLGQHEMIIKAIVTV